MSENKILNVNWIPAAGSALGAVTSAVVLSTLGVAGTLIGAALGSLVITVGGSIYSQSIERTKARIGSKVVNAKSRSEGRDDTSSGASTPDAHPANATGSSDGPVRNAPTGKRRSLPWKRILGLAAALFAVTMAVILAFELATGRTVSSYTGGSTTTTGGTSIPGISGFRSTSDGTGTTPGEQQQQEQEQVPGEVPTLPEDQAPVPGEEAPAAPGAPDAPEQQQAPMPEQQQGGQEQAPAPGGQEQAPAQ